ncbi:MAG: 50S ribosomal protein L18 [Kiritimatiellia bacterium]|jgi:large subunit ribosomal protein L18
MKIISRKENRTQRHERLRNKVIGTAKRPRMAVMVSNRKIYVQFIDDGEGRTLASAVSPESKSSVNVALAKQTGAMAAEAAKAKGIEAVVFDRGGFHYHGRIKALADAAREAGLKF